MLFRAVDRFKTVLEVLSTLGSLAKAKLTAEHQRLAELLDRLSAQRDPKAEKPEGSVVRMFL